MANEIVKKDENTAVAYGAEVNLGEIFAEELDGLTCERFCEAIRAEGVRSIPGTNYPLHKHPYFLASDATGSGREKTETPEYLPVSENTSKTVFTIPWFKHYRPEIIDRYIAVFRKVITNCKELL